MIPIVVTLVGIVIDDSDVQQAKATGPNDDNDDDNDDDNKDGNEDGNDGSDMTNIRNAIWNIY